MMNKETRNPKIVIVIASYRDDDLNNTVADLFQKAAMPELFKVVIFNQLMTGDHACRSAPHSQVIEIVTDASLSKGVCWARAQLYKYLPDDADFVLQLDSHMRFEPDWDVKLFNMWQQCPSDKAIISHYPPGFTRPDNFSNKRIRVLMPGRFNKLGVLVYQSDSYLYEKRPDKPLPSGFVSGNFLFAPAEALRQVAYDPYLYFFGEEITLSARLWTHGWDFFAPSDVLAWHNYGEQKTRPRHWQDHDISDLEARSVQRIQYLLADKPPNDDEALIYMDNFGLGNQRSLKDYEALIKVDFKLQKIYQKKYVSNGRPYWLFKR